MAQVWINGGDIILVGLRDYQDGKADVILKYSSDEARNLKAYGELPESGKTLRSVVTSLKNLQISENLTADRETPGN